MSHQIITEMIYNTKTRHIETWQHSNNVFPIMEEFYAMDVSTDEKMLRFIRYFAEGIWQSHICQEQFEILFKEYPELLIDAYRDQIIGKSWEETCVIKRRYDEIVESKCEEIVARFKQLVGIN